ncbi:MAG TPA: hypothetical protein VGN52_04105 [Burkholderiales bacterium]|jgi:hypothetical protein
MEWLNKLTPVEMAGIAVNVLVVGFLLFKMIQRRGVWNGLLFDARVTGTAGVIESVRGGGGLSKFKVQVLERDGAALTGIEWSISGPGWWGIDGVVLTPRQRDELQAAVEAAVRAIDNRISFPATTVEVAQGSGTQRQLQVRVLRDGAPCVSLKRVIPMWRWSLPGASAALTPQQARELGAALGRAAGQGATASMHGGRH